MKEQVTEVLWDFDINADVVWRYLRDVSTWDSWWPWIKEVFVLGTEVAGPYLILWKTPTGRSLDLELQVLVQADRHELEARFEGGGLMHFVLESVGTKTQVRVRWIGVNQDTGLDLQTLDELRSNLAARLEASRWWA